MCFSQEYSLDDVRACYLDAKNLESKSLLKRMTKEDYGNPIIKAYNNIANIMLIDHLYNPIKKYLSFKNYTQALDSLIESNQSNVEIRLLRYAVQNMSPSFLNYNQNLNDDIRYIVLNLDDESYRLQSYFYVILENIEYKKRLDTDK